MLKLKPFLFTFSLLLVLSLGFSTHIAAAEAQRFDDVKEAALLCIEELRRMDIENYGSSSSYTFNVILNDKAITKNVKTSVSDLFLYVLLGYPYIDARTGYTYYPNEVAGGVSIQLTFYPDTLQAWWGDAYDVAYKAAEEIEAKTLDLDEGAARTEQQLRLLNTWLAEKITYKRGNSAEHSVEGALLNGKSVCEGYAESFKLVCDILQIPSILVAGNANGYHVWNYAVVGDAAYHFDPTWDDGGSSATSTHFMLSHEEMETKAKKKRTFDPEDYDLFAALYFSKFDKLEIITRPPPAYREVDLEREIILGVGSDWLYATQVPGKKKSKIKEIPAKHIVEDGLSYANLVSSKEIILYVGPTARTMAPYHFEAKSKANPDKLVANYLINADPTGQTNGNWTLSKKDGQAVSVEELSYYEYYLSATGKAPLDADWTLMPEDGIEVASTKSKQTYLIRSKASYSVEDEVYTPASKSFKIKPAALGKAPKLKLNYKTEELKIKMGMAVVAATYTSESTPIDIAAKHSLLAEEAVTTSQKKGALLSVSDYLYSEARTLIIWQQASVKKPASAQQIYTLAPRAILSTQTINGSEGKAKLPAHLEVEKSAGAWSSGLPKISSTTTLSVRVKPTAKGTGTTDSGLAASETGSLSIVYDKWWQDETGKKAPKWGIIRLAITPLETEESGTGSETGNEPSDPGGEDTGDDSGGINPGP